MAEYSFLTTWLLEAERERVWDAIYDSERWRPAFKSNHDRVMRNGGEGLARLLGSPLLAVD